MKNYNISDEHIKQMIKEADKNEIVSSEYIANKAILSMFIIVIGCVICVLYKTGIPDHSLKIILYALGIYASVKILNLIGKLINQQNNN